MNPTISERARKLGVRIPPYNVRHCDEDAAIRAVYKDETGRDPDKRFTGGLARAQWEYGLRGTEYWTKDKREAVLLYTMRGN